MWNRRDREWTLRDAELYERVRVIVREEVGELVGEGRVVLTEQEYEGPEPEKPISGELDLKPTRAGTADFSIWVSDDTVSFSTGEAGAWDEIWTTNREWETDLRELIGCVRDGRYSERVSSGWFFGLKVRMHFAGVPSGRGPWRSDDYTLRYASTLSSEDGRLPMPPEGEFTYEAW